jgi:DNA polymerase elongation subunit (family B)
MLKFYTNVFRRKGNLFVKGYDVNGKRESKVVKYKPTLYIPSPKSTPYKNLKNQYVGEVNFDSIWEAQQFISKYKEVKNFAVFGFDKFEYNWISENFTKIIDYDFKLLSIGIIDIEVYCREGFPSPQKAAHEITVITIAKNNISYVLATKDYTPKNSNVKFLKCKDETDLLIKFLTLWEKFDFDIITGWNIEGFDIPYLINRITNLLGADIALKLSSWRNITSRSAVIMNKEQTFYNIEGLSILDYLTVYKKFCAHKRDSYTLNNISHIELQEQKIDYSEYESLNDLWDQNPEKYIDYNIHDVTLVANLENKLKYIERSVAVSYDAKVNFEDALTSVLLWEVIILNFLKRKNIVLPIGKHPGIKTRIEGAYVKDPQIELFDWVVSFDLTSLYPHILMGWNISPETFVGMQPVHIDNLLSNNYNITELKEKNLTLAGNGALYNKQIAGFIPELMEEQFNQRTLYKKKMIELKKKYAETKDESLKNEITKYDNYQYGKKIQLNSAYGAIANNYFLFYSRENAEAVTYTGQVVIRWVEQKINKFLNDYFKTKKDYVIASDTDSIYLNLGPYVKTLNLKDKIEIINALDKFSEEVITKQLKIFFDELTSNMNCPSNKLHMKREGIAEKAIWRAKKNYATYVWDNEGVRYTKPELKIMGMESVRSSTPEVCRKALTQSIELMFTEGEEKVQEFIKKFEEEYMKLPIFEIGRATSVNDFSSYNEKGEYIKGSPIQVKAAINYNNFIIKNNLTNKYRLINDGDKIKYLQLVKFNPIGDDVIGAPDGIFPAELNINKYIDKNLMFETTFLGPISSLMKGAGWTPRKLNNLKGFFQ